MNKAVGVWRHVKLTGKNRLRTCLFLIALVIAPVVCALMFSESMMSGIANKYICLSNGHIEVKPGIDSESLNAIADFVYSCDDVVSGYSLLYSANATASSSVKGVKSDYFNTVRLNELTFEKSDSTDKSSLKGIAISRSTADKLGVNVGDKLAMMVVPDTTDAVLRPVMVRVESVFYTGYDQLDSLISFIDYDYARTLFKDESSLSTEILVKTEFQESLSEICSLIEGNYSTWQNHNQSVFRNFEASREAIFIVLLTIVIVAAFFTASVAQQLIQDDLRDIAVMKLIGSSDSLVRRWAFSTVFTVTVIGIVIGTGLGTAIGYLLGPALKYISGLGLPGFSNYLLDFEVSMPWGQVAKILCLMLAVSSVSIRLSLSRTRRIKAIQLFTE